MSAESLTDGTAVRADIQLPIEGTNGDGDRLRRAFRPDARLFAYIDGRWWITNKTYGYAG